MDMDAFKLVLLCSIFAVAAVNGQDCSGVVVTPSGLVNINHNVSGILHIENDTTFCISDFYYDGAGPDAFLYLYYPGDTLSLKGGGVYTRVPGQDRIQFEVGRRWLGETLRFKVPEGHRTCDYGGFSIWCRYASQVFTVAQLPTNLFSTDGTGDTVMCTPSPGIAYVGSLPTTSNGVSGDLFIKDSKTFAIRDFNYDGTGVETFVYVFPVGVTPNASDADSGDIIPIPGTGEGQFPCTSYTDQVLEITIPDDVDMFTCDYGTFTIWSRTQFVFYTQISLNVATLFTNNPALADHNKAFVSCDRPPTRPGVLVGELTKEDHGLEGTFYIQDDKSFYIQLFSYDGQGPAAFLYYYRRGQMVQDTGNGYKINFSSTITNLPTGRSNSYKKHTPFIVDLNLAANENDVRACDVEWFTIWCQDFDVHFTRIQIPETIFTTDPNDPGIAMRTKVLCSQTEGPPPPGSGAPPTVSFLGVVTVMLVALAVLV